MLTELLLTAAVRLAGDFLLPLKLSALVVPSVALGSEVLCSPWLLFSPELSLDRSLGARLAVSSSLFTLAAERFFFLALPPEEFSAGGGSGLSFCDLLANNLADLLGVDGSSVLSSPVPKSVLGLCMCVHVRVYVHTCMYVCIHVHMYL